MIDLTQLDDMKEISLDGEYEIPSSLYEKSNIYFNATSKDKKTNYQENIT